MSVSDVEEVGDLPWSPAPGHFVRAFGERVRLLRLANRWTQNDLAKAMVKAGFKVHQSTIARLEVGERPTPIDEVGALAQIFRLPISAMFDTVGNLAPYEQLGYLKARREELSDELNRLGDEVDILTAELERVEAEISATRPLVNQRLAQHAENRDRVPF